MPVMVTGTAQARAEVCKKISRAQIMKVMMVTLSIKDCR
jgi:hypothetical protein